MLSKIISRFCLGSRLTCDGGGDESDGDVRNRTIREEWLQNVATKQQALDSIGADSDEKQIAPDVEEAGKTAVHKARVGVEGT